MIVRLNRRGPDCHIALMTATVGTETCHFLKSTQCNIPEDSFLHSFICKQPHYVLLKRKFSVTKNCKFECVHILCSVER